MYIHKLSLTLEHSMSISSPAVPGLIGGAHWAGMVRWGTVGELDWRRARGRKELRWPGGDRRAELQRASGTGQQGAPEGGDGGRGGAGAGVANARYPA